VPTPQPVLDAFEGAVEALTAAGATVIDLDAAGFTFPPATGELLVLDFDFRNDVKAYFATRVGVPVAGGTLQSAIDFNNAHADAEIAVLQSGPVLSRHSRSHPDPMIRSRCSG